MNKKWIALLILGLFIIAAVVIFAVINGNRNQTTANIDNQNEQENTNIQEEAKDEEEETVNQAGKVLVLYFTQSGNTETVAKMIHSEVGGDIVKLETTKTYSKSYNDLLDEAQEEQRNNARPELATNLNNIKEYDTIFLGYPNWWGDMPMPIYSFLDNYDLSGKTIAPFITHGGSGLSGTPDKIKQNEPQATVTDGLAVNGSNASSAKSDVTNWLTKIGF